MPWRRGIRRVSRPRLGRVAQPPTCPSPWVDLGLTAEYADNFGNTDKVRTCWRNDAICQVIYLTNYSLTGLPGCPSVSPAIWTQAALNTVHVPGGASAGQNKCSSYLL